MPYAAEFLAGFGLIKGKTLAGYVLVDATSTHDTVRRYQEYSYNITLTFQNQGYGSYENLFFALEPYLLAEHTIYGVRNPYRCVIDQVRDGDVDLFNDGTVVFHLKGHAYRH